MRIFHFRKYTRSDWLFLAAMIVFGLSAGVTFLAYMKGWASFSTLWKVSVSTSLILLVRIWR